MLERRRIPAVVLGVLLVAGAGLVILVAAPGLVGGDESFVVTSESMSPALERGDVVFVEDTDPGDITVDDIVTLAGGDGEYMTHRVIDVLEEDGEYYVETQGDANDVSDGVVSADAVVGVVTHDLPLVGYPLLFARSSVGLLVLVVLPGLALAGLGLHQLVTEIRDE